jgi:hypothetical protein
MPHGNMLSRLLVATLAAFAIAVPAAVAQPIDPVETTQSQTGQQMQGESAKEQGKAVSPAMQQELQGESAKDQGKAVSPTAQQELRSEAAKDPSRAPADFKELPGPPTWPVHPRVLTPPSPAATATDDGDGGGVDAPIIALIIAGALAIGGGLTVASMRHSRTRVAH